ncbi:MAG: FlgD immunoglobulin-like domain containing protein [Armatimonadota bacterium]
MRKAIDISADGRYVVFTALSPDGSDYCQVWLHDRLEGLTRRVSIYEDGHCYYPSVSNDGRRVAFTQLRGYTLPSTGDWDLFVYDADTQNVSCLTSDISDWVPIGDISGDGNVATFVRVLNSGAQRVYRQVIATGVREAMPKATDDEFHQLNPAISDGGAVVAYTSDLSIAVNGAIIVQSLSGDPTQLHSHPNVSGNGRVIVFHRLHGNSIGDPSGSWVQWRGVFLCDRDTGAVRHVSVDGLGQNIDIDPTAGVEIRPSISEDGRYVLFTRETRFSPAIYLRDMYASAATLLIAGSREHCINGDGRFVGYLNEQGVQVLDRGHEKLQAPTNLQVQEVEVTALQIGDSAGQLDVRWQDNSTDENAFQLHVRRFNGSLSEWEPWEWLHQTGPGAISYRTDQMASGRYQFRVRAINTNNLRLSEWCLSAPFDLGEVEFPLAPANLQAQMIASDSVNSSEPTATVKVTWQDNSDNETGFELQRAYQEPGGTWGAWESVSVLNAGVSQANMIVPLVPGSYRVQIRALGEFGNSSWVVSAAFTVAPPAPYNVVVQATGPVQDSEVPLALSWNYVQQHSHRFDVQWRRVLTGQFEWSEWENFDTGIPANLREWTASALLEQAGTYHFRIRAGTENIHSPWTESNILDFRPEPPAELQVSMSASNSIAEPATATFTATWWDNSDNEDGFQLERRQRDIVAPAQAEWSAWVAGGYSGVDTEEASFDLPLAPVEYQFRVQSTNAAGVSEWAESPAVACELPAPWDLAAVFAGPMNNGSVPVALTWNYPDEHLHLFTLHVRRFNLAYEQWTEWEDEQTGIEADRRDCDSGVDPETYGAYQWRLRATGAGMNSYWNVTPELPLTPEAPTKVEAAMIASTSVPDTPTATLHVTWEDNSDDETAFEIEFRRWPADAVNPPECTPVADAPANSTEADVQVEMGPGDCRVRVRSAHQAGGSEWEWSFQFTLQPPDPTDLAFGTEGPLQDPDGDPHFVVPLTWQYTDAHAHDFWIQSRRIDVGSGTWSEWGEDWGAWTAECSKREHGFAVWPPAGGIAAMQWRIRAEGPVPSEWCESGVMELIPSAPSNLQVAMIASDSASGDPIARLRATWEDNSDNEIRFPLWLRHRPVAPGQVQTSQEWGEWELLRNFADNLTEGTVDVPLRHGEHQVRLCAKGAAASSEWIESPVFTLQPPAPTELVFGATSPPQQTDTGFFVDVPLTWKHAEEHLHDFRIDMRRQLTEGGPWTEWGGDFANFPFDWDIPDAQKRRHEFRIFSSEVGMGRCVQWRIQTAGPVPSGWHESGVMNLVPDAPSNLQVEMIASDSRAYDPLDNFARIRATWEDNSISEFSFELMYRTRENSASAWSQWLYPSEHPQDTTEATRDLPPDRMEYQMSVMAKGPGGSSEKTVSDVFTLAPPPATSMEAVISGPADENGRRPVALTWEYSEDHRHSFGIEWRYIIAGESDWSTWQPAGLPIDHDARRCDDQTDPQLAAYQWRVRATAFSGESAWCESNVLDIRAAAPSNLQVAMSASDSRAADPNDNFARIQVTWKDNSNDETGFALYMRYRWLSWTGEQEDWGAWTLLGEYPPDTTATTKYLPLRYAQHELRIHALAEPAPSDWANSAIFTLQPPPATNMEAVISGPVGDDGRWPVHLTWEYSENHRHEFTAEWRYIAAGVGDWSEWQTAGVPIDHEGHQCDDQTDPQFIACQWRIRATSFSGNSPWSESNMLGVPPRVPGDVTVTPSEPSEQHPTGLHVNWQDNTDIEDGFQLEHRWRRDTGDAWSPWELRANLLPNVTAYDDHECQTGAHQYRVRAFTAWTDSEWVPSPSYLLALPERGAAHVTSYGQGLSLIALPLYPDTENLDPVQLGCEQNSWARWRPGDTPDAQGQYIYWVQDPQGYASLADRNSVPGKGFWARFSQATTTGIAGQQPPPEDEYVIPIRRDDAGPQGALPAANGWRGGWVQIGNPRLVDVPWIARGTGALRVRRDGYELTLAQAQAAGWCEDFVWGYEGSGPEALVFDPSIAPVGQSDVLKAWRGYWFLTYGPCELVIPPVSVTEAAAASARPAATFAPGDWMLRLIASIDGQVRSDAVVGQAANERRIPRPPAYPESVQLGVVSGRHHLGVDIRSSQETPTWDIEAMTSAVPCRVTLSWPDMSALPAAARPILLDLSSGSRIYMRTNSSYSFETTGGGTAQRLQLTLAPPDDCLLALSGLAAAATRGGGAEVRLQLSTPASVDVDLLNIGGRTVASICRQHELAAGANTLYWNGRSTSGTRLPHGRYLVRVTARSANGQQTGAVTSLQVGN